MALADSVPGVSGGTIAFLLGFYDQFIRSIDDLLRGNLEQKKQSLLFLIKLGIGWVCGMVLAVLVLTRVFETHIYAISSMFIGFILFAIPIVIKEEQEVLRMHAGSAFFAVIGAAAVCAITYFNPVSGGNSMNLDHLGLQLGIYIFLSGAIAISAMVLPGISGSTLLLIMGLYLPVITAVKDILHFDFSAFPTVFLFGCGVLVGIFKGPETLDDPQKALSFHTFNLLFFVIGGVVIAGLQKLKDVRES